MSDWPWVVGGLLLLGLGGGRRRRPSNVVSHDLPQTNRLVADITIQDAEGNVLLHEDDVASGGYVGAPNPPTESSRNVDEDTELHDVDDVPPAGGGGPTITIGDIEVTPANGTGAPPPANSGGSGAPAAPFSRADLIVAARKFMDAWAANGKHPLPPTSEYLVSAVQRAARLVVDGRYGPRTAGAVKWALGSCADPWDPRGAVRAYVPPR